jgi:biotin operon repressor
MFWLFKRKKEIEKIKEDTKKSFDGVKKDITAVAGWIKHLDSEKEIQKKDIFEIKQDISSIKEEIEGIKNAISIMNESEYKQVFKTPVKILNKQTPVYHVQTAVQTAVQTPKLEQFSITERAILWILLNTDMKLSYDDLAAMLGKERSTIRGQLNTIKQKGGEIIEEITEKNGKKRVYIPEKIKEIMLKRSKVRVKIEKEEKNDKKY